ncbi:hypothetical protein SLS62_004628 [Diatrype stigma]|uniref:F-box domain-containing protein n=1 Tax=Diatrype stigma TaxID=117547 RepID=A0AAN9V4I0_9PEZI
MPPPKRRELMDLPNELLIHVLTFTLPTGFESFMLTCKHVYALGVSLIAAHNERKKRWSVIAIEDHREDLGNAMAFLYEIAIKDTLAPAYIKEVYFLSEQPPDRADTMTAYLNEENRAWWRDDSKVHQMRGLVTTSWYLHTSGVDVEDWADKMFQSKHSQSSYPRDTRLRALNQGQVTLPENETS